MIIEIISGKAREHTSLQFSLNLCILFYMTALFQLQAGPITIPETLVDWSINAHWTSQGSISGEALFMTVPGMKGDLPQCIITGKVTNNHGN